MVFNNISVILVEDIGVPGHNVTSSTHHHERGSNPMNSYFERHLWKWIIIVRVI
jgi:hypothetical protein